MADEKQVLVVARDPTDRRRLTDMLDELGFVGCGVETKARAFDLIESGFDAVIVVSDLDTISRGVDLLERIAKIDAASRPKTLYLTTARNASRLGAAKRLANDCIEYERSGVEKAQLVSALRAICLLEPLVALVVSESTAGRNAPQIKLRGLGFETMEAADPSRAVSVCATRMPDVVFVDWHWYGCDADEDNRKAILLLHAVRGLPGGDKPKFVLVFDLQLADEADPAVEAGYEFCTTKPFDSDALHKQLKRFGIV